MSGTTSVAPADRRSRRWMGSRQIVALVIGVVAIVFIAVVGAVSYAVHGEVKPGAAALVGLPAALGAIAGTAVQQRISTRGLSLAFAGLLVAVAIDLLVS